MFGFILLLGLVWIALSAATPDSVTAGRIPAPQAGFLAPDFDLSTLDGRQVRLSDLRGQPVVINFWASWCPPCRAEMPALQRVQEEYASQGVVILIVNATAQDNLRDAQNFLQEYNLTMTVPLDPAGSTMQAYQVRSLPSTFFVARDGLISEVVIGGPMAEALLRTRVEQLLQEQP
jgi:thiol-disulfide isomerase/thioredoxin